jgi:protein associated with RNAse G/E
MQIGDSVEVRAYKSDGTRYRCWYATVEAVEADKVVVISSVGHWVEDIRGAWVSEHAIRTYYWLNRPYSLLEVDAPNGTLVKIYVNISSPVEIGDTQLSFTDYELDVSREPPKEARIVDEDEFREAVTKYGYSEEFQQTCYQTAREAIGVANGWIAKGMPT